MKINKSKKKKIIKKERARREGRKRGVSEKIDGAVRIEFL